MAEQLPGADRAVRILPDWLAQMPRDEWAETLKQAAARLTARAAKRPPDEREAAPVRADALQYGESMLRSDANVSPPGTAEFDDLLREIGA